MAADTLHGGDRNDTFRFDGPAASAYDAVTDFSQADGDHIALSSAGFGIASLSDVDILFGNVAATSAHATLIDNGGLATCT